MQITGKCRVCALPLSLVVDDDYMAIGDPMNLLPSACCNRCYDYKTKRDNLDRLIYLSCLNVIQARQAKRKNLNDIEANARVILRDLTKRYAYLIMAHNRYPTPMWDEAFVTLLMDHPNRVYNILGNFRIQARQQARSTPGWGLHGLIQPQTPVSSPEPVNTAETQPDTA